MIEQLGPLFDMLREHLWHGVVVFLRVAAVVMLLPAFGEHAVPIRVKLILAFAFTMIVAPAIPVQEVDIDNKFHQFVILLLSETVNGLALGLGFRLVIMALQTAGVIAAQALSLSQILGGAGVDPIPALGHVLVTAGLALAVMAGLHTHSARAMILSYSVLPLGQFPLPRNLTPWGVDQITRSFSLAFGLAAPFMIVSLLYNLTLGVINRAMPQLMVAFVGAPVITLGGLILLMLLAPLILTAWVDALGSFSASPFDALR